MTAQATEPLTAPATRARRRRTDRRNLLTALAFIGPASLGFVVFYLWPTVRGIYFSFTDYNVLGSPTWAGVDNYVTMASDGVFWNSVVVTAIFVVVTVVVQMAASMAIALLMHRVTNSLVVRGVILFPFLISGVVVALVWFLMLDYQIGIINHLLGLVGIDSIAFFGNTSTALVTTALVGVWRGMGYTALLIFAGLLTIPPQVYEASALDGASGSRTFFNVTLPLLRPVLAMVLVLTVIGAFQVFDIIAVTTKGGPVNSTRVLSYYIYELAFTRSNFGYASAISVVLFLVLALVSFAQLRLMRASDSDLA